MWRMRVLSKRLLILQVVGLFLIGLAAARNALEPGVAPWAGDLLLTAGAVLAAGCGWVPGLIGFGLASLVVAGDLTLSSSGVLGGILERLVVVAAVAIASSCFERSRRSEDQMQGL